METNLLQSLTKSKKTCYFISPHLDDAVFSAGALMTKLAKHNKLVVVTIFTNAAGTPPTYSAKQFLKQCMYDSAEKLFADRRAEDTEALKTLTKDIFHLGFTDSLWRKKSETVLGKLLPEVDHVYPTYRWHTITGKISSHDHPMIADIKQKLKEIITEKNPVIFCPTGIGNHVDHVITSKICTDIFSNVIYWSDFPYNEHANKSIQGFQTYTFAEDLSKKKKLMETYHTQYQAMFKNGVSLTPEAFYYKKI